MAWCENCNRDGFRKQDVEFCEETRKVLCHGCYSLVHPNWTPPAEIVDLTDSVPDRPKIGYAVSFSQADGLRAKISYGDTSILLHAPHEEIKKLLGG